MSITTPQCREIAPGVIEWTYREMSYSNDHRDPLTDEERVKGRTLGTLKRQRMTATVTVTIDVHGIAVRMGSRAVRSRGKKSVDGYVTVKATNVRAVDSLREEGTT